MGGAETRELTERVLSASMRVWPPSPPRAVALEWIEQAIGGQGLFRAQKIQECFGHLVDLRTEDALLFGGVSTSNAGERSLPRPIEGRHADLGQAGQILLTARKTVECNTSYEAQTNTVNFGTSDRHSMSNTVVRTRWR